MPPKPPATPEPLLFPRGVRFPRPDEFPPGADADMDRVRQAQLTTGYRLHPNAAGAFSAYIDANAHAINLYPLFHDLVFRLLPRSAALIIGRKDEAPHLGPYTIRAAALRLLEPHIQALQHDGLLAFGMIAQHDGRVEQVFVQPSKHLQVWTNQPDAAREVLAHHRIPEVAELQFLEQFPLVSEPLLTDDGRASWPLVLEQVRAGFGQLPKPDR